MRKDKHDKKEVPVTPKNVIHSLLYSLVHWLIVERFCSNIGKFKKGDRVKYNWKAKRYLGSIYLEGRLKEYTVKEVIKYSDSDGLEFTERFQGGDAFWYRKLYWWEKIKF